VQDKILTCRDCGQEFVFTAGEQEFYAEKGFNEPSRCAGCRAARKNSRGDSSRGESSFGGSRSREMFPAVCSQCGKQTEVPFEPRGDRPVYCSDCFATQRSSGGGRERRYDGGRAGGFGDRSGGYDDRSGGYNERGGRGGRGRGRDRRDDRRDRYGDSW
jgi:CxxC-x17-CxxC domain-containing protein